MFSHSELVEGKETIPRHSLQRSDIVKTRFDLVQNPQDGILNVG